MLFLYYIKLNYHNEQLTGDNWELDVHNPASSDQSPLTFEAYQFSSQDTVVLVLPFDPTANTITPMGEIGLHSSLMQ